MYQNSSTTGRGVNTGGGDSRVIFFLLPAFSPLYCNDPYVCPDLWIIRLHAMLHLFSLVSFAYLAKPCASACKRHSAPSSALRLCRRGTPAKSCCRRFWFRFSAITNNRKGDKPMNTTQQTSNPISEN